MSVQRLAAWLLAALVLAGCQLRPAWEEPSFADPNQLQRWTLNGRLGYQTAEDSGNASLEWQQGDAEGRIHFSGPMGFGSARLDWNDDLATLDTGRDQASASSPGELAWHLTGLWLPVEALHYWVRGLPWPHAPAIAERDDEGRLDRLSQLGWSMQFDRYQPIAGLQLPHRIRARHGEERFTLVVQRWRPAP